VLNSHKQTVYPGKKSISLLASKLMLESEECSCRGNENNDLFEEAF